MSPPPAAALHGQTRKYAEKREVILEAAARVFNRDGVRAGTLAAVAREVGLISNSVTYYFRHKDDLAAACLLRAIGTMCGVVDAAQAQPDPAARVRHYLRGYGRLLADADAGRRAPLISLNDILALTGEHAPQVFAAYNDMYRRVRRLLDSADGGKSADSRGSGSCADSPGNGTCATARNARAHLLMSLAQWMRPWIVRYEPDDYLRVADRVGDILLGGLAQRAGQWVESPGPEIGWPQPAVLNPATRDAYLRAATLLVNEQGYHGASVTRIAAMLNVTKGSFYHHHDTKDELLLACFERSFDLIRQVQTIANERPGDGWQRLTSATRSLVRFQLSAQGPLLRITARNALPHAMRSERLAAMNRLTERFGMMIVDGMLDGSIRPLDAAIGAQLVAGMINAASELKRWAPGITVENAASVYARPLFLGLLCPGADSRGPRQSLRLHSDPDPSRP